MKINQINPWIDSSEANYIKKIIQKTYLTEGNETLKFEIHNFGSTDSIIKETKSFMIASNSMAEVMHLTKYFGPYNITKTTENKFIFSKGDQSALLSKSGW